MKMLRSIALFAAAGGLFSSPPLFAAPNYPTRPIEQKYYADGPWTVAQTFTSASCDSKGNACDIFYPANLGANGFKHPIIVWANGTASTPVPSTTYGYFLRHLASWGFVVIATRDGATGSGQTIIDSANYMVARNGDPSSVFHHKLNVGRIGAAGHSQGATGAINSMLKSAELIRTAIAFHLPNQSYCSTAESCVQTSQLTSATTGSIFFVSGTLDFLISPDKQLLAGKLDSNTAYYNATPSPLQKVKAMLNGTGHNDIQGKPGCPGPLSLCFNGVHGYLGYPTAWMMWQLRDAADGQQAFKASGGEIFTATANWQSVLSNIP